MVAWSLSSFVKSSMRDTDFIRLRKILPVEIVLIWAASQNTKPPRREGARFCTGMLQIEEQRMVFFILVEALWFLLKKTMTNASIIQRGVFVQTETYWDWSLVRFYWKHSSLAEDNGHELDPSHIPACVWFDSTTGITKDVNQNRLEVKVLEIFIQKKTSLCSGLEAQSEIHIPARPGDNGFFFKLSNEQELFTLSKSCVLLFSSRKCDDKTQKRTTHVLCNTHVQLCSPPNEIRNLGVSCPTLLDFLSAASAGNRWKILLRDK